MDTWIGLYCSVCGHQAAVEMLGWKMLKSFTGKPTNKVEVTARCYCPDHETADIVPPWLLPDAPVVEASGAEGAWYEGDETSGVEP